MGDVNAHLDASWYMVSDYLSKCQLNGMSGNIVNVAVKITNEEYVLKPALVEYISEHGGLYILYEDNTSQYIPDWHGYYAWMYVAKGGVTFIDIRSFVEDTREMVYASK